MMRILLFFVLFVVYNDATPDFTEMSPVTFVLKPPTLTFHHTLTVCYATTLNNMMFSLNCIIL